MRLNIRILWGRRACEILERGQQLEGRSRSMLSRTLVSISAAVDVCTLQPCHCCSCIPGNLYSCMARGFITLDFVACRDTEQKQS